MSVDQPTLAKVTSTNTAIDYNAMEKEMKDGDDKGLPAHGSQASSKGEYVCRICLAEESSQENPMISP